jgi:hypothetical protein
LDLLKWTQAHTLTELETHLAMVAEAMLVAVVAASAMLQAMVKAATLVAVAAESAMPSAMEQESHQRCLLEPYSYKYSHPDS